jgi:hypothetical protein
VIGALNVSGFIEEDGQAFDAWHASFGAALLDIIPHGRDNVFVVVSRPSSHNPSGTVFWPMQRIMKRIKKGPEDGIYAYDFTMK